MECGCCSSSKVWSRRHSKRNLQSEGTQRDRERIRNKLCSLAMRSKRIRPIDLDHDEIDTQTDRVYQQQLAEYEKHPAEINQPFGTFAITEPTR